MGRMGRKVGWRGERDELERVGFLSYKAQSPVKCQQVVHACNNCRPGVIRT